MRLKLIAGVVVLAAFQRTRPGSPDVQQMAELSPATVLLPAAYVRVDIAGDNIQMPD